jgi:hypothetical protein
MLKKKILCKKYFYVVLSINKSNSDPECQLMTYLKRFFIKFKKEKFESVIFGLRT